MEPREAEDALRRLEQATAAAERLLGEAVRSLNPPPRGWQVPQDALWPPQRDAQRGLQLVVPPL